MEKYEIEFMRSFPKSLNGEITSLISKINLVSEHEPTSPKEFEINEEVIEIPGRVYYTKQNLMFGTKLTEHERLALNVYYTRHHDGHIREQCLRAIIESKESWVAPYVISLLGDYVIEIISVIYKNRNKLDKDIYKNFISNNNEFMFLTQQRVMSYWNCYYRRKYLKEDYVGFKMLRYFKEEICKI